MKYTRVTSSEHELFGKCRDIYCNSFPIEEQRSSEEQARIFKEHPNFFFYAITADIHGNGGSTTVGFISFWEFSSVIFGEHLAVDTLFRGQDIGGSVIEFLKSEAAKRGKPVVLEIEPPTDMTTRRRESFYLRHHFQHNDIEHYQPPFHKGLDPLRLALMSYPCQIKQPVYRQFMKEYAAIMPKF